MDWNSDRFFIISGFTARKPPASAVDDEQIKQKDAYGHGHGGAPTL
jgi:hypothetical protein